MSKKQDFIRSEQSRDKHPERDQVGSASNELQRGLEHMNADTGSQDRQAARSGKVENDHNRQGEQAPTQKHEGRRTPQSRHDREAHVGGDNQSQKRQGTPGAGRGKTGAG